LPDVVPRGDQFLYVKDGGEEAWLSMDGFHDGQIVVAGQTNVVPGCHGDAVNAKPNSAVQGACPANPAYLADAPTTPDAMAAYIAAHFGGAGPNGMGKGILNLLQYNYLRPAARAAVFDAATTIPGLRVVPDPFADKGTSTVGITWSASGTTMAPGQVTKSQGSTTLVFDKVTTEYLGVVTIGEKGERNDSGVPHIAIVDAVGQRS
jgi:hypothetical protein